MTRQPSSLCLVVFAMMVVAGDTFLQESVSHPFHMMFIPALVVPSITKDVALRCEENPDAEIDHVLTKVSKIQILKKVSKHHWRIIAVQTESGDPLLFDDKISASGRLIPWLVGAQFLEIRWAVADQDTLGVYRCDIIGIDEDNNSIQDMTTEVELKLGDVPIKDLISLLIQAKRDIKSSITENAKGLEELEAQRVEDLDKTKEFLPRSSTVAWPSGEYALLQPDTGCPVDLAFFGGNSGYVRLHTESTQEPNSNSVHVRTHLSQPVITRSGRNVFVYLRFCVVTRVFSDMPWPEGSYCIHAKGNQCPDGFSKGEIILDTEDHENADTFGGNVPFTPPTQLLFCCKNSTDAQVPVTLPTESPFYLYRHGGQCQQVNGMDAMEDFLEIHTESFVNQNSMAGTVPDSDLGQDSVVRVELCYYAKK